MHTIKKSSAPRMGSRMGGGRAHWSVGADHAPRAAYIGNEEPALIDLVNDPLIRRIMKSDGLEQLDLVRAIETARDRIGG